MLVQGTRRLCQYKGPEACVSMRDPKPVLVYVLEVLMLVPRRLKVPQTSSPAIRIGFTESQIRGIVTRIS